MVALEPLGGPGTSGAAEVRELLERHAEPHRAATRAARSSPTGRPCVGRFVRVVPHDYRRVLEAQARMRAAGLDRRRRRRWPRSRRTRGTSRAWGAPDGQADRVHRVPAPAGARPPAARAHPATGARRTRTCDDGALRDQAAALHGLRRPVLPHRRAHQRDGVGLPDQQPDPRVERPRLPRPVAGGVDPPPPHEQLPGVHRPRLPGAVRGLLHRGHQRRPGHDQDDRAGDRRPRLGGGLDHSRRRR